MDLTRDFIKAKRPCASGFRWLLRTHGEGGDYQPLLDALVRDGRIDDACWLLDQFGPTDAVLRLSALETDALVFAGSVEIDGPIEIAGLLRAGRSVTARGGVRTGGDLIAGEDIRAGASVRCDGALRAGGDVRVDGAIETAGPLTAQGMLRCRWHLQSAGAVSIGGNATIDDDLFCEADVAIGKTLHVRGAIAVSGELRTAQGLLCGADLHCTQHLEAGWGILAHGRMQAGGAIRAGESLIAGGTIHAGEGYGIFAGLAVPREAWPASARVQAFEQPAGLMSGHWAGPDATV